MSNANVLLDKWMKTCSIKTQAEAARRLGKAGSATISNWRSGYAKPDNEAIAQMCEECGEDAAHWIGKLNLDFEQSPRLRKVWLRLARVAAVLMITVAGARAEATAPAVGPVKPLITAPHCIFCQIRQKARQITGMAVAWLATLVLGASRDGTQTLTPSLGV